MQNLRHPVNFIKKNHPIYVGFLVIIAIVALGALIATSTGFASPMKVFATYGSYSSSHSSDTESDEGEHSDSDDSGYGHDDAYGDEHSDDDHEDTDQHEDEDKSDDCDKDSEHAYSSSYKSSSQSSYSHSSYGSDDDSKDESHSEYGSHSSDSDDDKGSYGDKSYGSKGHDDESNNDHEDDDCNPPPPPPPPPVYEAPVCTLSALPSAVVSGATSKLSWTTLRATSFSIDQGFGVVTPIGSGAASTSALTTTKTFIGTVIGLGGTKTCSAVVTVQPPPEPPPPPPAIPTCALSATPASITAGQSATLSWVSTNANTLVFNAGIGTTTPVASSTLLVTASTTTTYTGTFTGAGGTVSCSAIVMVTPPGGGGTNPSCSLSISPTTVVKGSAVTLAWGGVAIQNIFIDKGIGTTTSTAGSQSITPDVGTHTYMGAFTATNGATLSCTASVTVTEPIVTGCVGGCGGGGSGGGGGGGGGGSSVPPNVVLSILSHPAVAPLAFLYLSQIPYTGLELGFVGTMLYWITLIGWSLVLAYLVLFFVLPFLSRKLGKFSAQVSALINAEPQKFATVPLMPEHTESNETHTHASSSAKSLRTLLMQTNENPKTTGRGYSAFDGFKSFANGNVLTIEDIVKGLSKPSQVSEKSATVVLEHEPRVHSEPVRQNVEPIYKSVEPIYENVEPIEMHSAIVTGAIEVRSFVTALIEGDRGGIFSMLRNHVRSGGKPEHLLTQAACTLDDAYRARIDGTDCDPEIVRLAARHSTPTLEKLVSSLSNAIDSSYSVGITGAKLALTRALAVIGA